MSVILKLILSVNSIYERSKIYKDIVYNDFSIEKKIPILYKTGCKEKVLKKFEDMKIENDVLSGRFGILYLFIGELDYINEIKNEFYDEIYFDFSYKINFQDSISNFNSCVTNLNESMGLTGEGVVIAFVDTGIDYRLDAFRKEDGTTRIKYIYYANTGKSYGSDEINKALMEDNPFSVIPEDDTKGHGTAVASIACAGGNISRDLYGVAPKSEIISLNIIHDVDSTETLFHFVMKSMDFLLEKQKEEGFPLVVNLSFSTNFGAHTGTTLLEEYVREFALNTNVTVVVSAGNEGGAGHHKSGKITDKGEKIDLEVSGDHKSIPISLYKGLLTELFIKISSPKAGSSQVLKIIEGIQTIRLGDDVVTILYTGPTNINVVGYIEIVLSAQINPFISQGVWNIELTLGNEYESDYNMWIPVVESIGNRTRFLNPDNNNTIGSPATVVNVISVGSYNYRTETVSLFSGRGAANVIEDNLKPDLLAAGEDVRAIFPDGRVSTVSGTSFSAPIVSGICALLMEWGIVKGNKTNLYGEVIKYFLIKGATRLRSISYPNNSYGYGFACASRSFREIMENINDISNLINNGSLIREGEGELTPFDIDKINAKMCTLENLNSPDRVLFLANVNVNIGDLGGEVCIYPLEFKSGNEFTAIVSIPMDKLDEFEAKYFSNENISLQRSYYYALCSDSISPISDAGIYQTQNNEYLDLSGRDVIVGIIDTGIDYLNKEFINEIGESRILEIWDQTIQGGYGSEILFGSVYTKDQITSAIKLKENGGDPYTIVPSRDVIGHGTAMAGITSASGYGIVKGGAPNSDLVVVKLREISEEFKEFLDFDVDGAPIFDQVSIHMALMYLRKVKLKYNKPMVVLIPLQTNGGDHSGNTILSNQINEYSNNVGFVVVSPSGNQANKQIHALGEIQKIGEEGLLELFVDRGQRRLRVNLYVENFARASLIIISPSGERTQKFTLSFGKTYDFKFLFEETRMKILCEIEENSIEMIQFIEILFDGLRSGIWQIILISEDEQRLKYDAYLSLREFLRPETKFINSNSGNTVTSPATSRLAVSVAYYNQNLNSIVSDSGQGLTLDGRVSPIFAAGGVDVLTTGKGNTEYLITGGSAAAAVAAGGIALILEWGIVKKNRVQLNSAVIIWLLISSATTPKGYDFPNQYWGYGLLNIRNVFEMLR